MSQVGSSRRRHRHEHLAIVVAIVAATTSHAVAVAAAAAMDLLSGWGGLGKPALRVTSGQPGEPTLPLKPSCDGDAVLAAAARALTCVSPFVADRAACWVEVANRLESDRLTCHVEELPTVAFELTPIRAQDLAQIDPEPLLETLSEERQQAFEKVQQQQQLALVQEAERRRTEIERDSQLVEIAKPAVELAPDQARFLSEYDNKVEQQSVARGTNQEDLVARSQAKELEAKPNPREPSIDKPREDAPPGTNALAPKVPGPLSMRKPGAELPAESAQVARHKGLLGGSLAPIGDGMRARRGDGLVSAEERTRSEQPQGSGGGGGGAPPMPDLRPSEKVLERAIGGGSVDFLDDVEEGEETALNTKQFVFATFFNRMKRRVHQSWDPFSVWARHDPTGHVYGYKTRVTRVRVTLSPGGELTKIIVSRSSGVDLLDQEAMRAFRAAQPFPNPPAGLVDASGNITFEFGFHLEIGGGQRGEWKVFRAL